MGLLARPRFLYPQITQMINSLPHHAPNSESKEDFLCEQEIPCGPELCKSERPRRPALGMETKAPGPLSRRGSFNSLRRSKLEKPRARAAVRAGRTHTPFGKRLAALSPRPRFLDDGLLRLQPARARAHGRARLEKTREENRHAAGG